jgi:Uma2 family endonuclease
MTVPKKNSKKLNQEQLLKALIYEIDNDKPIYYKGYKEVLNHTKNIEECMGSSYLQSLIIMCIVEELLKILPKNYQILSNEIGLKIGKNKHRANDIAIYKKDDLTKIKLKDKYLEIPPKIAIEIDTKAELENISSMDYISQKTDDLLNFGVEKVIWIFTGIEKIMLAEKNKTWFIQSWNTEIEILDSISFNIQILIDKDK